MNWIKRLFASIVIVMLSCFVGIIAVELALRIINSNDPWVHTREANILRNFQFSYDVSRLYESTDPIFNYVRDQYGLRDSCENPADIDILTIGGSTTDQRYVSLNSTFQNIIEKHMKTSFDTFGCVSNAGIDGHSTWGHLYSFEKWLPLIPELNPKIILLYIGINDADFHRTSPKVGYDTGHTDEGIKEFLKRFEIIRALLPIYRLIRQQSDNAAYANHAPKLYKDEDYTVNTLNEQTELLSNRNAEAFRLRMEGLLNAIEEFGAKPLCVTQPHRYVKKIDGQKRGLKNVLGEDFSGMDYDHSIRKLNEVIFDLCGLNTVDLYSHKFSDSHFYDGVHTTALGSIEIGNVISQFLINNNVLK